VRSGPLSIPWHQHSPPENRRETLTKLNKLAPVPMTKLVIHSITPKSGALIFSTPATLESEPRPFWALHISPPCSRLIVEREIGTALLAMCSEVKLRDHASDYLIIQAFSTIEWESLQPLAKVRRPLTHNVIGGDLHWLRVVTCTLHNNVVDISIPRNIEQRTHKLGRGSSTRTFHPFGAGRPLPEEQIRGYTLYTQHQWWNNPWKTLNLRVRRQIIQSRY